MGGRRGQDGGIGLKQDVAIGLVGTAILVVAMLGVFRYEATQGGGSWQVDFETATVAATRASGTTAEGAASALGIDVSERNVTRAEFALEWTDDAGAADEFELQVTSPSGESRAARGSSGRVAVAFENLAPLPPSVRLLGEDEGTIGERVERDYASDAAAGRWNVTVRLLSAGDQTAPVGGVVLQQDAGNAWTLAPTLTAYRATVTRA